MLAMSTPPVPGPSTTGEHPVPTRGQALRWRIIPILLVVSLAPLALLALGASVLFSEALEGKALELHERVVRDHAIAIERYLAERFRALSLVAATQPQQQLSDPQTLKRTFDRLQGSYDDAFVDLGVIDADGHHLAYVGPYDLQDKSYRESPWFREVMARGSYVSDVFLGYRGVPHCVIAVRSTAGQQPWILRATINSEQFDALVRTGQLGSTGDVFILDSGNAYQTPPRHGRVLESSNLTLPEHHAGLRSRTIDLDGTAMVRTTQWLNHGRWVLVVQQSEQEIFAPVRRAFGWGALLFGLAVCLVVSTTVVATRHLTGQIDRASEQRDALSRELLRSAKLASVGELATGLAHEINNPLAIISAERTNLDDQVTTLDLAPPLRDDLQASIRRIRQQVDRCGAITAKLLKFGRKSESNPRRTLLEPHLCDVLRLMEQQAKVRNVVIELDVEPGLPAPWVDPTELEQVLVNLVTNSLHAMPHGGHIRLRARDDHGQVALSVEDTGVGIAAEDLELVFQPFYTTKPPGEGTGLGLSVCYGIVQGWGGTMEAESKLGHGTTMTIHLPTASPQKRAASNPPRSIHESVRQSHPSPAR